MMMKRHLACAAVIGLMSACTQEQSLRDTVATGYYVSNQTVEKITRCASGRWSAKSARLVAVPLAGGTSIEVWDRDS